MDKLKVKVRSAPVNVRFIVATVLGASSLALWPSDGDGWQFYVAAPLLGIGALFSIGAGIKALIDDYQLRRAVEISEQVSDDHGTARQADWWEIVRRQMDKPSSGNFLGLKDGAYPVFAPPKTPFCLVEAPPGAWKTIALVVGSIIHKAMMGYSMFIADPKSELGPQLIPALRKLGFEVWAINPTGQYIDLVGDEQINVYQGVVDAVFADDDTRKDATGLASEYAKIHYPEERGEKNPYFPNGSRRCISFAILSQAVWEPAHCTPSDVYSLLNSPKRFMERIEDMLVFDTGIDDDPLAEHIRGEAANLQARAKDNQENFGAFLEGATQRLLSFSPGGRLGGYGREGHLDISAMRKRQIIVFAMTPLSHLKEFGPFISLLNSNVISACKRNPNGRPVHLVLEEALNYRFNDISSDMETMRGLKMSMDIYIQSFAGLQKLYGKEVAAAVESYSDVRIYAGINSYERAKVISDMLAEATIRKQEFSYGAEAKEVNVSSREMAKRHMSPDEILAMPKGTAWVFINGMRPIMVQLTPYWEVSPWAEMVGDNPIEGPAPKVTPKFHIDYPDQERDGRKAA